MVFPISLLRFIIVLKVNSKIYDNVRFPLKDYPDIENTVLVFGSWIKTSEPNSVRLNLVRDGILFQSPYHSGNATWEYLSVSAPLKYRFINGAVTFDKSKPYNTFENKT